MPSSELPLSRFRVIDLTLARAGPTCIRTLADWGASVIRVEPPARDDKDEITGLRAGSDFQNMHRNKRSITVDLKTAEGLGIFMKLAERADVIVENMRADVKHRLGVDYDAVRRVNPRIVYGSISGFGQDGPYAPRAGVDQIAQGMAGLMSITGLPGQGPVRVGIPISDLCAGGFLAQGILVALLSREVTGEGQWVSTSLIETQIAMLDFQATRWLVDGVVPKQEGNNHPTAIPTDLFPTKDGHVNIAAAGQAIYRRFCRALGAPDLVDEPLYATGKARSENRNALNERIAEYTRQRTTDEWVELFSKAGVPCGPVNTIDQVFADPQVRHLNPTRKLEHPRLGTLELVANPVTLSSHAKDLRSPAPDLGEHTDAVLGELGYGADQIAELKRRNIV